jgi:hypothetical protein
MQVLRAKVGIFGTYARMFEVSEREMEYYKQNLAEQIAKKLIDENIAQIIVHERGEDVPLGFPPYDNSTIGVKLFVIPWEYMRTVGSRFEIRDAENVKTMKELEKFRIIEATTEHVIVNREPMNLDELNVMRQAAMDALCREVLEKNTMGVIFPGEEKGIRKWERRS